MSINMGYLEIIEPYYFQKQPIPTTGLWGWYRSDMGITKDSNDLISQWDDQSGNGNHATQSDLNKKPLFISNQINGLPIINFSGSKNLLTPTFNSNYCSIYIVYKKTTANNTGVLLSNSDSNTLSGLYDWNNSLIYFNTNTITYNTATGGGRISYTLLYLTYNNGRLKIYENGNNIADVTSIGSNFIFDNFGFWKYTGAYLNGNIAEIIVRSISDSDTDLSTTASYLNTKFNIY